MCDTHIRIREYASCTNAQRLKLIGPKNVHPVIYFGIRNSLPTKYVNVKDNDL